MRVLVLWLSFFCGSALAAAPGYDLSLGAELHGNTLKVAPVVTAPAGAKLRYDVTTTRVGRGGNSDSRQSGNITVGDDGKASLSQLAVSVSEEDRYEVRVQVYEDGRLVASKTLTHPE